MKKRNTKRVKPGDLVRPIKRFRTLLPIEDGEYTVTTVATLHTIAFDGAPLIALKEYPDKVFMAFHFEYVELKDDLFVI